MSHIPSSAMPHAKPIESVDGDATTHVNGATPAETQPVAAAAPTEPVTDAAPVVSPTPDAALTSKMNPASAAETKSANDVEKRPDVTPTGDGKRPGWGLVAALAGGVVALGAVAAAAAPLARGHAAPKREQRERKADRKARKAKAKG